MGDRGNIAVQFDGDKTKRVWFYTHWSGSELDQIIARALKRKERWSDPSYLARIIFCEMVKSDPSGATGFGIDFDPCDNEHAFRVVCTQSKTVFQEGDTREGFNRLPAKESDLVPVPFEEFWKRANEE